MRIRTLWIGLAALAATGVMAHAPGWRWSLPPGIEAPDVPVGNPMTPAKVALGRRLFYDGRLSVGGTMSCATCHEQRRAFASATVTHPGIGGNPGRRNVPGLANMAWLPSLTVADPRVRTLEVQLLTPLFGKHPVEMGARPQEMISRLVRDDCYKRMFAAAFPESGGTIDMKGVAAAIAAFQRTLISYRAPYDADRAGDTAALSPAARAGAARFATACASCHAGPNQTDGGFHAIAPADPGAGDRGLFETTGKAADDGRFRTPPLRNVALTAPYLHDGSAATLADAIARHRGGETADLGPDADADMAAFLGSLTDEHFVRNPAFSRPAAMCDIGRPG